jgi:hypothetical protein
MTPWVGLTFGVEFVGGGVGVTTGGFLVGMGVPIGVADSIGSAVNTGGTGVLTGGFGVAGSVLGVLVTTGFVGVAGGRDGATGVGVRDGWPWTLVVVAARPGFEG